MCSRNPKAGKNKKTENDKTERINRKHNHEIIKSKFKENAKMLCKRLCQLNGKQTNKQNKPGTERRYLQTAYKTKDSHLEYVRTSQKLNVKKQNPNRKVGTRILY